MMVSELQSNLNKEAQVYYANIDSKHQRFIIEDDNDIIAWIDMPYQQYPHPGHKALMENEFNQARWQRIHDLVALANR